MSGAEDKRKMLSKGTYRVSLLGVRGTVSRRVRVPGGHLGSAIGLGGPLRLRVRGWRGVRVC
jgi:hypothetical protein